MRVNAKAMLALGAVLVIVAGFGSDAEAASISVLPATQNALIGDTVSIDIVVSGLTDPIGGFSLLLNFDDTILQGVSYTNDPDTKMGGAPLDLSFGFGPGGTSALDLFFLEDASVDATTAAVSQGSGFTLATVSFLALANGTSPLTLSLGGAGAAYLSNFTGDFTVAADTANGSVCVGSGCQTTPVPEPATIWLFAIGVAALVVKQRILPKRI